MDQRKLRSQYKILINKKNGVEGIAAPFSHKRLFTVKETILFYIKMAEDKRLELLTTGVKDRCSTY